MRDLIPGIALMLALLAATPAVAGGIAILGTELEDNGDGDGFADTHETVQMRLTVRNTTGQALTGVVATLGDDGAGLVCVGDPSIVIGDLAPGETRVTEDTFTFVVSDVDRAALSLGPFDPLPVSFPVTISSSPGGQEAFPSTVVVDLDLDVSGGSGPTTFLESFEGTLGTFEVDNMDQGTSSHAGSDGYRCQYHDPDWVNSYIYGFPQVTDTCYLGTTPLQADAVFWELSGPAFSPLGGRGFSGFHSLFFGIDLGPPLHWTTPMQVLEAATTTEPILLDWQSSPTLSFMHQVSLFDIRSYAPSGEDRAVDRGVVMAQLADDLGNAAGPWIKLYPYQNVYDRTASEMVLNCMFDPIDDGNTEETFFDPSDPGRVFGPSSTCWPEPVYAFVGETSEAFDAANVGDVDGPGLAGSWGLGTWIESRFDLSRFRGRPVRLRFLGSMIRGNAFNPDETWEDLFHLNPDPGDDGWWVDDVTVTGALSTAAVVSLDDKDNSALSGDEDVDGVVDGCDNCATVANADQLDGDLDGAGAACDCNDASASTFPGATEVNDGVDNNCPGDAGHGSVDEVSGTVVFTSSSTLEWPAQAGALRYDVARADAPDLDAGCTAFTNLATPTLSDPSTPAAGQIRFYVVRAAAPNAGSWGQTSNATERTVPCL